jgi:hypothetical protein
MKHSETITKIAASLVKAQANIGAAHKGSANPYFKSSYADLGSIMEVVKQPLLDQGISVLQPVGHTESGQTYVETVLLHESGEFIADTMIVTCAKEKDPQAQGSAISYARRYSLQSMLFVPALDDDGEGAMNRNSKPEPKQELAPKKSAVSDKPNLKKLLEELAKAGITPDEALETLKYKKGEDGLPKVPDNASNLLLCKDETAAKILEVFGYLTDGVIEWKALKKP